MCSILAILNISENAKELRAKALELSRRQRHRGPDWSGIYVGDCAILAHERLAIVDIDHGAQPLFTPDHKHVLAVNGEIYNHVLLKETLGQTYEYQTLSDCEVILPLYLQHGAAFLNDLNGIFAFVLYDINADRFLIARDPIGVVPLYYGYDAQGRLYIASELKAILDTCTIVKDFPPGHYFDGSTDEPVRYYNPAWREYDAVQGREVSIEAIRESLEAAVVRQLMCDVPYGVLLSGGLDSSLIAAIARHYTARRVEDGGRSEAWWPQLHSFAIGLKESPDLVAARTVADAIGSVHHEICFTVQEGIDALSDVIYHLETFDVTTIRASTPMYLMARRIKAMGIKMVLSGEGADEIFGGYLYFHKAPNARAFHEETVRKLDQLHKFDCQRANKSMAAWGVEARVPFLDRAFLDVTMSFDAKEKMVGADRMEKHILREAFDGMLPTEILWRQKEQFSDGVGYSWIDSLREHAEKEVADADFTSAHFRFPVNTPQTREAYLYRSIFQSHFPEDGAVLCVPEGPSIACSTPTAIQWDAAFAANPDPSGRAVAVHKKATG